MGSNFDININNYSDKELLDIISYSDDISNKYLIEKKINDIISKIKNYNNNQDLLTFFNAVKERLLNTNNTRDQDDQDDDDDEDDDDDQDDDDDEEDNDDQDDDDDQDDEEGDDYQNNQSREWLKNQYLPPRNRNYKDITDRTRAFDLLNPPFRPIMNRRNLGIPNYVQSAISQDTLNPNLRQIETRVILIDSKDRPIIVPFSNDVTNPSNPTNFTCNLSLHLQNVISMRVTSVLIPNTFYIINDNIGNNFFKIKDISSSSPQTITITIPNGNYRINDFKNILNKKLSDNSFDVSFSIVDDSGDTIIDNSLLLSNKLQIKNKSTNTYHITFFEKSDNNNNYYTTCLAYYLGFRFDNKDKKCENKIPNSWKIELERGEQYNAQTVPDIVGPRYFNLCVDDFQNNQSSSSFVNIKNIDNKLTLPGYVNKLNRENQNDSSFNCFKKLRQFVPENGINLTQNQIHSANSILLEQKKPNDRLETFNNQHVLATINIPSDLLFDNSKTSICINNIPKDSNLIRNYFGPVNIQRLKISLFDNYGFLVNLNNHDWNFTIQVEQLYQY